MSEDMKIGRVPENVVRSLLIDQSDVQTKVGHVANFDEKDKINDLEENILLDHLVNTKKSPNSSEFVGLTKEELKCYITNPKWKRIRWIIAIIYLFIIISLLIGSILLIISSQRCPPKQIIQWYQKEIIYEIDLPTFRDSNEDGIGDIKGIQEKLKYFEENSIKSILLRSSIFNITYGKSIQLDGKHLQEQKIDLYQIDPKVGNEKDFQDFIKILNRKDMHLIIDLPLSSTIDPLGNMWYGSNQKLSKKIDNPCIQNPSDLSCEYYQVYGQLPLNFNDPIISKEAQFLIDYWLTKKKVNGIRVNLPLICNNSNGIYQISSKTIKEWNEIISNIGKKSKTKLLLFDIPFPLQKSIKNDQINSKTGKPLLLFNKNQNININGKFLEKKLKPLEKTSSKDHFWQLGSTRSTDQIGIINSNQFSKFVVLTINMLIGGTPIILYGEEINLNQKMNPLMSWTPSGLSGGFSSCSSDKCKQIFLSHQNQLSKTSVKREEALGGESKDSLLKFFRYLSKLRQSESFQYGLLETGSHEKFNLFWFIREARGHRGYIILINLNENVNEKDHISLHEMTKHDVPFDIHCEYQWPEWSLPKSNESAINSDNLLINSQSINIFSWKEKLIKGNILSQNAKEHSNKE